MLLKIEKILFKKESSKMIEDFILNSFILMKRMTFSPLVLIGLLITSLSLILNLKDTNKYIKRFKEHKNIEKFINTIFYTSTVLIFMFIISIVVSYVEVITPWSTVRCSIYVVVSTLYLGSLFYIANNLFTIIYILKEIVRTSLKDDS